MTIQADIDLLSHFYPLWVGEGNQFVIVDGVKLPVGYNCDHIQLYIEIPLDYPITPPGISPHRVYVPSTLMFRGQQPRDMHTSCDPVVQVSGFGPWAWWCYEMIRWNPIRDNLVTFVGMVKADLAHIPIVERAEPAVVVPRQVAVVAPRQVAPPPKKPNWFYRLLGF